MAKLNRGMSCLVVVMIICCAIGAVRAAVYTVGDTSGWSMTGDYGTWASDKAFAIGDTLVFNYSPGHTVDEVSENDYKSCTTGNAIASDSSGATSVTLKTAGAHYFICGAPGHCSGGMKLSVTVAAATSTGGGAAASSPGTTTSPAAGSTTSMAPPTAVRTPAGTVTGSSSSAILSPAAAVSFAICVVMIQSFIY